VNDDAMELEQQAKFDLLVRQLERSRQRTKTNYQMHVAALAAIGYGYIAIVCLGLLSSLWLLKWSIEVAQQQPIVAIDTNILLAHPDRLCLGFGLIVTVAIALFWTKAPILTDLEIDRAEFPELFETIDELSQQLNAPKIHHVIVNFEHNAAVSQVPHFGWRENCHNYLILGLPLLQSLTPAQFRATLAHELEHLSNNDSSFMGYILRVGRMWEQLTADNNLFIFQWFFRWYEPVIKAYSFISVRDREYAADASAQRMTSPEIAASDLIQTYIYQYYLQECFSRQLDRQARECETPPSDVVTQMLAALRQPLDPQTAQVWLGLILGQATDTDDTHPCLSDRLAAMGYPTPKSWTPRPILQTAAERFFGDRLADLAAELDVQWYEQRKAVWLCQYRHARAQRSYLTTLNRHRETAPLTRGEATVRADLTTELDGELLALPLWQAILDRDPNCALANYQVGKAIVNRGHASGCTYLERAIALDPDLVVASCEELYRFHIFKGNLATAEIYLEWRQHHLHKQWRSKLERNIKDTDRFIPHDLDANLIAEICQKLARYPAIDRAYLVCKPMQVFQDRPLYILSLKLVKNRDVDFDRLQANLESESEICDRLRIELNFIRRLVIAMFDSDRSAFSDERELKLIGNIQKIPDARIF
jgi:Zn-dependent protease with chaperone function